ncbi:iron ABC transporter permease [Curtobacterium sp. MCPF17_047]|uniref:FecCD family ABC transporter permease n=1 Tax=unclassified Curtobacterium TaxID=257496 RepID=UPI000DAA68C3|nr:MULTISPECIES: iron chelate uptake ABC transporter family permease subunit [unclassified Curtobacterium]PZE61162.1 iron ABC transporter permease [Curtobacterium sp. MCPF17_001]PZF66647.1 iron ABC transporter permease [Curtobacterium sp. MCPF17_047]
MRSRSVAPPAPAPVSRLVLATVLAVVVLAVACALSVAVGSRPIPLGVVVDTLLHPGRHDEIGLIVLGNRVPRTVVGLLAGAALGVAGAVMQGITRNPLADPSILGVNAGAALAVVVGIAVFGISGTATYLPFAFAGAALAALLVYGIAAVARGGLTPVGLALSGAVTAAALSSVTTAVLVTNASLLDQLRFWQVGALAGGDLGTAGVVVTPVVVGLVIAVGLGRSLNTLALGDELAASLGQRVVLVRAVGAVVTVLLAGSAVAAAGPVAFVGLAVPHAVRRLSGPDHRWTILLSAVVAPALLLVADVIGRVVAYPGELQVGIVTALIGAPVFIALVRSRAVRGL